MVKKPVKKGNKVKENFEIIKMNRKDLNEAPYNPRKMTEDHRKNLKAYIKKQGLLLPAINFNKRTGRLLSGHQRLQIMDMLNQTPDYEITVIVNDLSPKEEIEANVKLNSKNLQGEWDPVKLYEITLENPEIDLEKDLAFTGEELDLMFTELDLSATKAFENEQQVYEDYQEANMAKLKETKEKYKKRIEKDNKDGKTIYGKDDNYTVTFIFNNNTEKKQFMKDLKISTEEKYLPGKFLYDIANQKIRLSKVQRRGKQNGKEKTSRKTSKKAN